MKAESEYLHVAVGVINDKTGRILISLRHDAAPQGGLWEFPGGKVESGETVEQALARELKEELEIIVDECKPLIKIKHHYSDLSVLLDVWKVEAYEGKPQGHEGQKIKWVEPSRLLDHSFPKANYPIITAARLPAEYAILNSGEGVDLLKNLKIILESGVTLIQARLKSLSAHSVKQFFEHAIPLCHQKGVCLLVNSAVESAYQLNADGIHLTAQDLLMLKQRPVDVKWVAASCHNQTELQHAEKIGVDFAVIAPVLETKTHPDAQPLGWDKFSQLTKDVNIPVFALGGLQKKDKDMACRMGGQGVAGISTFIKKS
jgi:8-oxo-dGTP diphosphatase